MCSCRGPRACKQCSRIYNTLLLQAMALYIHGPLRCKNLLGRIPNPHSRPALAAPQHTPGSHSNARSQRTPPGRLCADQQHHTPTAAPTGERPAHHLHGPDPDAQPPTLEAVQHTHSPTRSGPQTAAPPGCMMMFTERNTAHE